jgi:hypothetical protein
MTTFVTSFIDLNINEDRPLNKDTNFYIEKGKELLSNPYPFIVFIDKITYELIDIKRENILFHIISLSDLNLPNKDIILPANRNIKKDTFYYLSIMCKKTFFIKKAIEINPFNSTHFSWIDFGILHIIKNDEMIEFNKSLEQIFNYKCNKIRIPGCIHPNYNQFVLDNIIWSFCGGFFCGDKESLLIFSNETENIVSLLEKQNLLVWEVNIWLLIYQKNPELFDWYYGDHNLTMLKNF